MSTDAEHAAQVRARLAAATPGPWEAWQNKDAEYEVGQPGRGYFGHVATPNRGPDDYGQANADLIANAPADLERLMARAEAAEDRLRAAWEQGDRDAAEKISMHVERQQALARAKAAEAKVVRVEALFIRHPRALAFSRSLLRAALTDPKEQP